MAGIRPLSVFGAEVAYIDFGSINGAASIPATPTQGGLNVTATSHTPRLQRSSPSATCRFRCRI
jgi:hypothetical protein